MADDFAPRSLIRKWTVQDPVWAAHRIFRLEAEVERLREDNNALRAQIDRYFADPSLVSEDLREELRLVSEQRDSLANDLEARSECDCLAGVVAHRDDCASRDKPRET
jgi:hypothetical protein